MSCERLTATFPRRLSSPRIKHFLSDSIIGLIDPMGFLSGFQRRIGWWPCKPLRRTVLSRLHATIIFYTARLSRWNHVRQSSAIGLIVR